MVEMCSSSSSDSRVAVLMQTSLLTKTFVELKHFFIYKFNSNDECVDEGLLVVYLTEL